jgi:dolichyl-phosphate beta-glucosyltransferase
MRNSPTVTIVIPAYNEARRLPFTLAGWTDFLAGQPFAARVLVVDDGSQDATAQVVEDAARRQPELVALERLPANQGKGGAVRVGMLRATSDFVFYADADMNVAPHHLLPALELLGSTVDVVVGTRSLRAYATQERSVPRVVAGGLVQLTRRALALTRVRDTQCGFKGFRQPVARAIFSRTRINSFAFDVEVLFLAGRLGARLVELPVETEFRAGSTFDVSRHLRPFLRDLVQVRLNDLRGDYRLP